MERDEIVNGQNVTELRQYIEMVKSDPSLADRSLTLTAHWMDGDRSRIEFKDVVTHIGGEGELNPMLMFLASLAACDVDVIATHAALLGLEIESLSVETTGHFDVRSYLGLDNAPGPGYSSIASTVRIRAPGATPEQVAHLREKCERCSPVGDSLAKAIPLKLEFEAVPSE